MSIPIENLDAVVYKEIGVDEAANHGALYLGDSPMLVGQWECTNCHLITKLFRSTPSTHPLECSHCKVSFAWSQSAMIAHLRSK